MIIKGITIFGQVVDVECNIADFLELVDVLEKAEKYTSEPGFDTESEEGRYDKGNQRSGSAEEKRKKRIH